MDLLRQRVDLLNTKETQIAEIKDMLRSMESVVGVRFVSDDNGVLLSAWVFVGLNVLVAWFTIKVLLVDPLFRSLDGL